MSTKEKRQVQEDIRKAKRIIEGWIPNFGGRTYPAFLQTNEPLEQYYPYFALEGKSVLSVTGSGDQVLEAIKEGTTEVFAFDQNHFASHIANLKVASVKALPWWDFVPFFRTFDTSYYHRVRPFLNEIESYFWDFVIEETTPSQREKLFRDPFMMYPSGTYPQKDKYFYPEQYKTLQERISFGSYHLLTCSLHQLPKQTALKNKTFDVILLSNIYDWLGTERQKNFYSFINQEISPFLTERGICCAYLPINCNDRIENKNFEEVYFGDNKIHFYTYQKKYNNN